MRSKTSIAAAATLTVLSWGASTPSAIADPPTPAPITPAAPTMPPGAPAPLTTIDHDGVYIIGKDLAPGTYATAGPRDSNHRCYWRRMNSPDPSVPGNVIDSAMSAKPQVVLVDPTDRAFKTSGCQPWHLTDAQPDSTGPSPNLSPQARIALGLLGNLGGGAPAPAAPPPPAPAN
ncbi:MAG: hypothetical protein WCE30_27050 [Mycobacterium sp.]